MTRARVLLATALGVAALAPPVHAAFLVQLGDARTIVVDRFAAEADGVHLYRDGEDLRVPPGHARVLREVPDGGAPHPEAPARGSTANEERARLAARQRRVERHLLALQQQEFEAEARGEPREVVDRLGHAFKRTQKRRQDLARQLADDAR